MASEQQIRAAIVAIRSVHLVEERLLLEQVIVVSNEAVSSSDEECCLDPVRKLEVFACQPVEGWVGDVIWDGVAGDGTVA